MNGIQVMQDLTAVLIFEDNKVSREMLYSEFEAILDGFAPLPELSNKGVDAVYLQLTGQLLVRSAVFFKINFDAEGFADRRWNIPLQQLAENSAKGPDLGAGAIRLACRSQCCIEWHQKSLWDPEMDVAGIHFGGIKKSINMNRMGFLKEELIPDGIVTSQDKAASGTQPQQIKALQERFDNSLNQYKLGLSSLSEKHETHVQELKNKFQSHIHDARNTLDEMKLQFTAEQNKNQELKSVIEGQVTKIQGLREYYEHKLSSAQNSDSDELEALREGFAADLEVQMSAAKAELNEQLKIKEVELMYSQTQQENLLEEIQRIQIEKNELLSNSGNHLLEKLNDKGISFVSFQPGAGHMAIRVDEIPDFLSDLHGFVAEKCGVSKRHYIEWLERYKNPVCQKLVEGAMPCGKPISRIENPSDLLIGENDRCELHKFASGT